MFCYYAFLLFASDSKKAKQSKQISNIVALDIEKVCLRLQVIYKLSLFTFCCNAILGYHTGNYPRSLSPDAGPFITENSVVNFLFDLMHIFKKIFLRNYL